MLKGSILGSLASLTVVVALLSSLAAAQLRTDYYAGICPSLEAIVRNSVRQSMAQDPISAPPATLRLFFHDCAVMGCDASIMIINSNGDDEWRNPGDYSLKPQGFQTVLDAKAAVDSDPQCRHKSGGPNYTVELGRYDGTSSTNRSVMLPDFDGNLDSLSAFFSNLGLSQTDMIALSGGHTLGAANCSFFQHRISGHDPSMDSSFATQLRAACARHGLAFLDDSWAHSAFDNSYYRNLQYGRGLLRSDQVLYTDQRSRGTVDYYAAHQDTFFYDFGVAMMKLGRFRVKTAADGEIRRDCRYPN